MVVLLDAHNEWIKPRFQDFKTMAKYNSSLLNIIASLKLCGEEVTEVQKI